MRHLSATDRLLTAAGAALSATLNPGSGLRAYPQGESTDDAALTPEERRESGALMRVNHVGEVCAQALYAAQALTARDPKLREHYDRAAEEEREHLGWTRARLAELDSRPSLLNPLWHAGSFGIGLLAGRWGDHASLGFVIETERQVEQHLEGHLNRLPPHDTRSRAIVSHMRDDEARHARQAEQAGGARPPRQVRWLMRAAAKVMTTTAYYL